MALLANHIHVRTVQFWKAFLAHPELHPFMPAALRAAIEKQVAQILPAMEIAESATEADEEAAAKIEAVFNRAHDLLLRLHEGARYRYHTKTAGLTALAPLRVGTTPLEDEVRLATFLQTVEALQPKFIWLADEGITFASSKKLHAELIAANAAAPALEAANDKVAAALEALRKARPASHAIWSDDGARLDAWVLAHVPPEQQNAFGRDRRKRPRGPAEPPRTTTKPPDGK